MGCCNYEQQQLSNLGSGEPPCFDGGQAAAQLSLDCSGHRSQEEPGSSAPTSQHTAREFQAASWHTRPFTTGPRRLLHLPPSLPPSQHPVGTRTARCYPHSPRHFTVPGLCEGYLRADEVLSILYHPAQMPPLPGSLLSTPYSKVLPPLAVRPASPASPELNSIFSLVFAYAGPSAFPLQL